MGVPDSPMHVAIVAHITWREAGYLQRAPVGGGRHVAEQLPGGGQPHLAHHLRHAQVLAQLACHLQQQQQCLSIVS